MKNKQLPWDKFKSGELPTPPLHVYKNGGPNFYAVPEDHAEALRDLCEMAKDMAWTESSLTNATQIFADKLWRDIFEKEGKE